MFVTKSQIYVATFLFGVGFFVGIIINFLYFFINKIPFRLLRAVMQFLLCLLLIFTYYICYFYAKLPNYAIYMPIFFLLGWFVERKTLHSVLAYCLKKVYNSIIKRG